MLLNENIKKLYNNDSQMYKKTNYYLIYMKFKMKEKINFIKEIDYMRKIIKQKQLSI